MQFTFPLLSALLMFLMPLLQGCQLPIDRMIPAAQAGDLTVVSACDAMASRGGDICRMKEGQDVGGAWHLVLPVGGAVTGGELYVYFKDGASKSYAIKSNVVDVPWVDLVGPGQWSTDQGGVVLAKGEVRWNDNGGIEQTTALLGEAILIVLKKGYEPLPVDSGLEAFKGKCSFTYGYSTAGRSAISPLVCK